jgi:hypothetical protein
MNKIQSYGLRPRTSGLISSTSSIIRIFLIIAIAAFFLYWITKEILDYYPSSYKIEEAFQSTNQQSADNRPLSYRPEPRPGNSLRVNSDPGAFDMDVLRSHKLYKVRRDVAKVTGEEPEIQTAVWSLQWEVPTTYMLDLLKKVISEPIIIPRSHLSTSIPDWLASYQPGSPTYNPKNPVYTYDNLSSLTPDQLVVPALKPLHELIQIVKLHILTRINLQYLTEGYALDVHQFQPFSIVKSQWMQVIVLQPEDLIARKPLRLDFIVNLMIHRPVKTHTFNIQARFTAEFTRFSGSEDMQVVVAISSLELIGSSIQGNVLPNSYVTGLSELTRKEASISPISDAENPVIPGVNIALTDNKTNTINVNRQITEFLAKKDNERELFNQRTAILQNTRSGKIDPVAQTVNRDNLLSDSAPYSCFAVNPEGQSVKLGEITNPVECQSYIPGINSVGVWDKPCTEDAECPFFGKNGNGNYTNSFGGCDKSSGQCQMPVGVARIGYKHYSKKTEPSCYNCPPGFENDKCCKLQATNERMRGPDYRFQDDEFLRKAFPAVSELAKLGLKPN